MASLVAGNVGTVIDAARSVLGRPYVWAGTFKGNGGGDCSGLVVFSFGKAGISLPHFTGFLINKGVEVSRADLQPGDLVFPDPGHVQIYTGNGRIIEAPHTGTVVTERAMWGFWRARRILSNTGTSDPQGFNPVGDAAKAAAGLLIPGLPNFQDLFANSRHLAMRALEVVLGATLIIVGLSEISNPKVQQVMNSPAIKTAVKAIK
jgi:hypothetical protein